MPVRAREIAAVAFAASVITAAIAVPVLRSPSERIFGAPLAGHHHDPFTFMQMIERPMAGGVYAQPATDVPAAFIARAAGPVAAYNWIVLLSFPLAAVAAYLLARHAGLLPVWAGAAGFAFAFAPFHIAHAAYHPHVAQTYWIPLYLLALWRCLDRPTPVAIALLLAAAAGVALSNFYGGLIAAVMTPAVVAAYGLWGNRSGLARRMAVTSSVVAAISAAGLAYVWYAARPIVTDPAAYTAPAADLIRYGARWWSYLLPPALHPVLGASSERILNAAGVDVGLLEQQVMPGIGVLMLAAVALVAWRRRAPGEAVRSSIPILAALAAVAFVWSLAGGPSAWLYPVLPMFRAYARFGVVVQLMAALLAAVGAQYLWRRGTTAARVACALLVAVTAVEYAVWPPALSRPIVPTLAHRWAGAQAGPGRVLDCAAPTGASAAERWATRYRVRPAAPPFDDCTEPNVADKLAAAGFTHLIVRRESAEGRWLARRRTPGLQRAAAFDDSDVFAIAATAPLVHTVSMSGFLPREHDATWTWRWMAGDASWWITNNTDAPLTASLSLELMSFTPSQVMTVLLDGREVQRVGIAAARDVYEVGPFALTPGGHEIVFRAGAAPLSVGFGGWRWRAAAGGRP
jgi:hypothetical protein